MYSETDVLIVVVLTVGAAGAVFWQRHGQELEAKHQAFLDVPLLKIEAEPWRYNHSIFLRNWPV